MKCIQATYYKFKFVPFEIDVSDCTINAISITIVTNNFICRNLISVFMVLFYSLSKSIQNMGESKRTLVPKLRVIRAYKKHANGSTRQPSPYELVCHDGEDIRIHDTIRKVDYKRTSHKFVVVNIYAFIYFNVHHNNIQYKSKANMSRFVSSSKTRVARIRDPTFSSYMFVFRQFSTHFILWKQIQTFPNIY